MRCKHAKVKASSVVCITVKNNPVKKPGKLLAAVVASITVTIQCVTVFVAAYSC